MRENHYYLTRLECMLTLLILMLIDIGPVPITATGALLILFFRPQWFKNLIDHIYASKHFHS